MGKISKIRTIVDTVRYLKPIQVYGRFLLYTNRFGGVKITWNKLPVKEGRQFVLIESIPFRQSFKSNSFEFLNLKHDFGNHIDWNWLGYGRLWTYNLNYFEFLDQKDIKKEEGLRVIDDFIAQLQTNKIGLEPYPLSLRCINWIRFFCKHNIHNPGYDSVLYKQLQLLTSKIEYHLLGNHLLENSFALLLGAYYFNDSNLYGIAKKILQKELKEQTLLDGGHFELSPMYHCTMLFRILDCYNMATNNSLFNKEPEVLLRCVAQDMLGWLQAVTFKNGDIPLMNDAAFGIAPNTRQLIEYGGRLGLTPSKITLKSSGYRKLSNKKFECVADVGNVGPDYQPGHAHADTLNFELHINGRPVIVDTGTSTYEINQTRFDERSTSAHNTVVIGDKNSSEVWAGHRVAKRARVEIIEDKKTKVHASHNGYKKLGVIHSRCFEINDDLLIITDKIRNEGKAYLHFHPCEKIKIMDNSIIGSDFIISIDGAKEINICEFCYAPEFNKRIPSTRIQVLFDDFLTTTFK